MKTILALLVSTIVAIIPPPFDGMPLEQPLPTFCEKHSIYFVATMKIFVCKDCHIHIISICKTNCSCTHIAITILAEPRIETYFGYFHDYPITKGSRVYVPVEERIYDDILKSIRDFFENTKENFIKSS